MCNLFHPGRKTMWTLRLRQPPCGVAEHGSTEPARGGTSSGPPAQKMGRKISAQMPPANAPAILNFLKMWYTVL